MPNAKMLLPLALVLLATACGPVEWLNPCFKEGDLVLDPALVGAWSDEDGRSILKFHKTGDKDYELLNTEIHANDADPEQARYEAHLVRLGAYLFLDLVPKAPQVTSGSFKLPLTPSSDVTPFQPHLVKVGDGLYASLVQGQQVSEASQESGSCEVRLTRAHWVFRVWLDGNSLRLADLSENWFKEAVDNGRVHINFDRIDDSTVLTASTEELQAFLLEFGGDGLAFPENNMPEYRRQE